MFESQCVNSRATSCFNPLKWMYVLLGIQSANKHGEVTRMTRFRDILRLSNMGLSQRSIASSCQCSRNTVSDVLSRANQKGLIWPLPEDLGDVDLQQMLFPEKAQSAPRRVPDCEHIHKEMAKSGVTLSLLWSEYCETCRLSGEIPLKYTQYCNYYRKFASTTKATMYNGPRNLDNRKGSV